MLCVFGVMKFFFVLVRVILFFRYINFRKYIFKGICGFISFINGLFNEFLKCYKKNY